MSKAQPQAGIESLNMVTLVVDDQDEALAFYTETLGFEKRMDDEYELEGSAGRWLTVGLPGRETEIALVTPEDMAMDEATAETLASMKGIQTWWTFRTDDCRKSVAALEKAGVEITDGPTDYPWGVEAMVADPFGNEFSIFEYAR